MRRRSFIATLPLAGATSVLAADRSTSGASRKPGAEDAADPWTDLVAAPLTDLGQAASRNVRITGKAAITSFGAAASGVAKTVRFTDALSLTHNPVSLILPNNGFNLPIAANDTLTAVSLGDGKWIVTTYQPSTVAAKIDRTSSHGAMAYKYAIGADAQTGSPDFAVDGGYDRTKVLMKSLFLADPGDTPELGLVIAGGTAAAPTPWKAPYLGAFLYGWPMDNTGSVGSPMGKGFEDSQWLGRNAQIIFALAGDATPTSRPGALTFGVCPPGMQIPIERGWFGTRGGFVLAGRAVENALADGRIAYPWSPSTGQAKYHPVPGLNWYDYGDDATLTLIASDSSDNKVLAIKRGDDLSRGAGFDFAFAADELRLGRFGRGAFEPKWAWTASGDQLPAVARAVDIGSPARPVRSLHADRLDVHRATRGPAAVFRSERPDLSGDLLTLSAARAAGPGFNFLRAVAGPEGEAEPAVEIDGAGHAAIAGALTGEGRGSGAYMEWADGNPYAEDRVGWAVVVEGRKIRRATVADPTSAIIGVVTARAQVIGDAAWRHWSGKHLADDFGRPQTRPVEHVRWREPVTEVRQVERTRTVREMVRRPRLERVEVVERTPRLEQVGDRWVERLVETRRVIERPAVVVVVVHDEQGVPLVDGCGAPRTAEVPVHEEVEAERTETFAEPAMVEVGAIEHCYPAHAVPAGLRVPAKAERLVLEEKVPNPAFDPALAYAPRRDRPEWDVVSFSGPEVVRTGERVGDRWIRMRGISDAAEEWLVR